MRDRIASHAVVFRGLVYDTSPLKTTAWKASDRRIAALNMSRTSGAPNDSFLSDPLKRYLRLSGVPIKLCRFILGSGIIFLSVRSF